jgi:hypothetical protein
VPDLIREILTSLENKFLRGMCGTFLPWHLYCLENPDKELVFTKRAAEEIFRAFMPLGVTVMSTKENKRYARLVNEYSGIDPDVPAAEINAIRMTGEENKKLINIIGEFASKNVDRVEDIQRTVRDFAENGEKIPIPMPEKLSGEDSSLDIRMRLKQIERYLSAKRKEPST